MQMTDEDEWVEAIKSLKRDVHVNPDAKRRAIEHLKSMYSMELTSQFWSPVAITSGKDGVVVRLEGTFEDGDQTAIETKHTDSNTTEIDWYVGEKIVYSEVKHHADD